MGERMRGTETPIKMAEMAKGMSERAVVVVVVMAECNGMIRSIVTWELVEPVRRG